MAWDFATTHPVELVAITPARSSAVKLPTVRRLGFAVTDVRYICAIPAMWMGEIAHLPLSQHGLGGVYTFSRGGLVALPDIT